MDLLYVPSLLMSSILSLPFQIISPLKFFSAILFIRKKKTTLMASVVQVYTTIYTVAKDEEVVIVVAVKKIIQGVKMFYPTPSRLSE